MHPGYMQKQVPLGERQVQSGWPGHKSAKKFTTRYSDRYNRCHVKIMLNIFLDAQSSVTTPLSSKFFVRRHDAQQKAQ